MDKYFEVLKRRVAGVPVYVILLVVVLAAAYAAFKMKPAKDPAPDATEPASDPVQGDPVQTVNPVFVANRAPLNGSSDGESSVETNETWARRAIEWLVVSQKANEEVARVAIQKYLEGSVLSATQNDLKNKAVTQFGLPPELPTGGGVESKPVTPINESPATKQGNPPTRHKVKNSRDNQWTELARVYYGRTDSIAVNLLRAGNSSRDAAEPFPVGTTIYIPKWITPRYYRATSATRTADAIARKNSMSGARVIALNYGMKFPVKVGTSVRVA